MAKPRIRVPVGYDYRTHAPLALPEGEGSGKSAMFEAAMSGRRLATWRATSSNLNTLLRAEGATLRNRSREAVRNNEYAGAACDSFVARSIGHGIKPKWQLKDPDLRMRTHELFADWTDESDADGVTDFYGQQALCARAIFEAGEVFVRRRPRYASDGLSVPLQIELLEAEMVPLELNAVAPNGNVIRAGIEFDRRGRRVAYHVLKTHPGDSTIVLRDAQTIRVDAADMLHIFQPLRPGQIRGVPATARSLVRLYILDQYDDAELERKKTAALHVGVITTPSGDDGGMYDPAGRAAGGDATDGTPGMEDIPTLEPGMFMKLKDGESVTFSEPADVGGSYDAFQYRTICRITSGLSGIYHDISGDTSKSNYSSMRAGIVSNRPKIEQFQFAIMVYQLCRPVVAHWWMDAAVLSGALSIPGYASNPAVQRDARRIEWLPPKPDWVDPLDDVRAEVMQINAGLKSRAQAVSERGYDVEQVDIENAQDRRREADLGLSYGASSTLGTSDAGPARPASDRRQQPSSTSSDDQDDAA